MQWKSNIPVSFAPTASRTRTKPNGIKIPYTFGDIRGHAPRCQAAKLLSIQLPRQPRKVWADQHMMLVDTVEKSLQIYPSLIGIIALII